MRVFVGYGYNPRDVWIEDLVFPILRVMEFVVAHGKDMQGQELAPEVQRLIEQSDAVVGFFTIREGQEAAEFNSHIWVRDELLYAIAKNKPIIPVKEFGANIPDGLLGNRQYILLHRDEKLAGISELVRAIGRKNIRRLKLDADERLARNLLQWRLRPEFEMRYRILDEDGAESQHYRGRLELVEQGFYINVAEVPRKAFVEVEGCLGGQTKFSSGWVSADTIRVPI